LDGESGHRKRAAEAYPTVDKQARNATVADRKSLTTAAEPVSIPLLVGARLADGRHRKRATPVARGLARALVRMHGTMPA
jgi:hypothetical protein